MWKSINKQITICVCKFVFIIICVCLCIEGWTSCGRLRKPEEKLKQEVAKESAMKKEELLGEQMAD